LARGDAIELAAGLMGISSHEARLSARLSHPSAALEPDRTAVPEAAIEQLQTVLRSIADDRGWPAPISGPARDDVDRAWGRALGRAVDRNSAADSGVWGFLALVVVPDLVRWRAPNGPRAIYVEAHDHVLGRLWWRDCVLGPDLMEGSGGDPLTEDELVALFRRPDLVANPSVARAIVRCVLTDATAGPRRLDRMKQLVIDVLHVTPAVCLDVLDESELDDVMDELFNMT
jgi:hypothetical protein